MLEDTHTMTIHISLKDQFYIKSNLTKIEAFRFKPLNLIATFVKYQNSPVISFNRKSIEKPKLNKYLINHLTFTEKEPLCSEWKTRTKFVNIFHSNCRLLCCMLITDVILSEYTLLCTFTYIHRHSLDEWMNEYECNKLSVHPMTSSSRENQLPTMPTKAYFKNIPLKEESKRGNDNILIGPVKQRMDSF